MSETDSGIANDERQPCELDAEARRLLERGIELQAAGKGELALVELRQAFERAPQNARVRSYLGLSIAREERGFDEARELCESAVKAEFDNADLYLNLGLVFLGFQLRPDGLRYLRRGLMLEPGHPGICRVLEGLGNRSVPMIRFLPRRHPLNRWLGSLRAALTWRWQRDSGTKSVA